jgi:hypothetical protein
MPHVSGNVGQIFPVPCGTVFMPAGDARATNIGDLAGPKKTDYKNKHDFVPPKSRVEFA